MTSPGRFGRESPSSGPTIQTGWNLVCAYSERVYEKVFWKRTRNSLALSWPRFQKALHRLRQPSGQALFHLLKELFRGGHQRWLRSTCLQKAGGSSGGSKGCLHFSLAARHVRVRDCQDGELRRMARRFRLGRPVYVNCWCLTSFPAAPTNFDNFSSPVLNSKFSPPSLGCSSSRKLYQLSDLSAVIIRAQVSSISVIARS